MRRSLGLACLLALTMAAAASAQGITLFGDARLGFGYNINNNGTLDARRFEPDGSPIPIADKKGNEELRAISRVRFGVIMAGESDSGIGYGAIMRADHGARAGANPDGQICIGYTDLPAFVSNADVQFPPIEQISLGVTGEYGAVFGALIYSNADGGDGTDDRFETVAGGLGYDFGVWRANGFFQSVSAADGPETFELVDGETAWGLGAAYDLGGGAALRGGHVRDFGANDRADLGVAFGF